MEKRKIDLNKYADMHEEKVFKGNDGTEIVVRDHISFTDKENMARELAIVCVIDHDGSCVYTSSELEKQKLYYIAKYYTDIDTEEIEPDNIADFLINNGLSKQIYEFIDGDLETTMSIYWNLYCALDTTYADDGSITKALRTSFGFLFNGEDITESLAKAEATKDAVYGAVNAWRQVEKEQSEKIDDGKLLVGGNVLNFAKKSE